MGLTVYSQLPCSPRFRGHSSSLLVIGLVSVGNLHEIRGDYVQKRTLARRERERAMAGATPRSARQGMILFHDPELSATDVTRSRKNGPGPERPTRVHKNLTSTEARDVFRSGNRMHLVPICVHVVQPCEIKMCVY